MKERKAIIKDKKLRGEGAESVFMERATERGLQVSKPWGEMNSFDFVVGRPSRFVSVQVKSTLFQMKKGPTTGYECSVRGGHKAYGAGSFDFLAAYVVPDDAWYIIPAELIRGKESITLYPESKTARYEKYREAWHLLREASQISPDAAGDDQPCEHAAGAGAASVEDAADAPPAVRHPGSALARMEAAFDYVRRYMEGNYPRPHKPDEELGQK
jgi:hypothetical protein